MPKLVFQEVLIIITHTEHQFLYQVILNCFMPALWNIFMCLFVHISSKKNCGIDSNRLRSIRWKSIRSHID